MHECMGGLLAHLLLGLLVGQQRGLHERAGLPLRQECALLLAEGAEHVEEVALHDVGEVGEAVAAGLVHLDERLGRVAC